jgi:acetyltransferase
VSNQAEFAIVLADAWQGRGLGRQLLKTLIEVATGVGIAVIYGITLADNLAMLDLMRALDFAVAGEPGDATLRRATFRLEPG